MAQVIPSDTQQVGDPGHTTVVHNNIADMLGLLTAVIAQAGGSPNLSPVPPATAAVAAVQAIQAGQMMDDSRDFHPEAYGSNVGDGKIVTDGAMSTGTATLTCATSTPFVSTDVGKYVLVQNAGSATLTGNTLVATITGFTSASVVTLSTNALVTVSSAYICFGTDCTAAINSAVQAAYAYALAGPLEAVIQFLPKIYMVAGALVQGNASWGPGNAQIPFPFVAMNKPKITIVFEGIPDTPLIHYGLNSTPIVAGAAVVNCATTLGTNHVTFGPASVFGGYTHQQGAGDSVFSNFRPVFQGLTVVTPYNGTYSAVDCYGCIGMGIRSLSCVTFAAPPDMANPTTNISVGNQWTFGLRTPTTSNDGNPFIDNYVASGYGYGLALSEHVSGSRGFTLNNVMGIGLFSTTSGGGMLHNTRLHYWCCESNNIQLGCIGGTDTICIDIGTLDVDGGVGSPKYVISDPNSLIRGQVLLRGNGSTYTFNGGMTKLKVIDGDLAPGHVTAPGVPATTVSFQNPFWRDAAIAITPGASTCAVTIDGTATGITLASSGVGQTFFLPSGKSIVLTYTSAPTWTWVVL
jgi:hypothetical protein